MPREIDCANAAKDQFSKFCSKTPTLKGLIHKLPLYFVISLSEVDLHCHQSFFPFVVPNSVYDLLSNKHVLYDPPSFLEGSLVWGYDFAYNRSKLQCDNLGHHFLTKVTKTDRMKTIKVYELLYFGNKDNEGVIHIISISSIAEAILNTSNNFILDDIPIKPVKDS